MFPRRRGAPFWIGSSLVVLATLATACTSAAGDGDSETFTSVEPESSDAVAPLTITYENDAVVCNGQPQPVATISGAEPGEVLALTSALPVEFPDAVADEAGTHRISWSCPAEEARLRWTLTATGRSSGRTADITFGGTEEPDPTLVLAFTPAEDPFTCDGRLKPVGTLSGAKPDESLTVASAHTGSSVHQADGLGEVPLWWRCQPGEAADWEVSVDSTSGDRSLRFMVRGVAQDLAQLPELVVELTENPFVCDGKSRAFATVSNLHAFEDVTFTAETAETLLPGSADENGSLPLNWQCGTDEVGTTWTLTAYGVSSGRSVTVTFTGGAPAAGSVTPLSLTVAEDPFVCNDQSRPFATIGNLLPNEFVDFTSPDADNLREGQANESGLLPIRWLCSADEIGQVWTITATGRASGKSIAVTITGAAPA